MSRNIGKKGRIMLEREQKHFERLMKILNFLHKKDNKTDADFIPITVDEIVSGTELTASCVRSELMLMIEKEVISVDCNKGTLQISIL